MLVCGKHVVSADCRIPGDLCPACGEVAEKLLTDAVGGRKKLAIPTKRRTYLPLFGAGIAWTASIFVPSNLSSSFVSSWPRYGTFIVLNWSLQGCSSRFFSLERSISLTNHSSWTSSASATVYTSPTKRRSSNIAKTPSRFGGL